MGKRYYDNYDYEEAYKEQCKKLEEAEMERWMKEGWVNCLYRTSTYKSTNTESNTTLLESMVYPSFKFKADMPKTEKKRETSPSQSNLNDKNARRYLIRLANINFGKGDIWATFGWNNGLLPETYEDAKKDVVNFIRRINRKRKKLGLENAKYIYIIAFEEYTRPHFHLLISGGIDRDELERMWGKCDRPNTRNISPDENFLLTGLATYITQNPHGTKRWCPSKNLKKPDEPKRSYSKFRKAKVEKMAFDSSVLQAEMEKAYPGFTFLDAEVKHNGVNAAFYIWDGENQGPANQETHGYKVGDKVRVIDNITYNGVRFATYYDEYDVIQVNGDRVVIGIGNTVTAAVNAANIAKDEEIAEAPADAEVPTDIPTQEETENAHGFKVGQKVKVINAYDYYGNMFKCWYSKYDVIEVKNDRIVIGIGNTVTAAVNAANLAVA